MQKADMSPFAAVQHKSAPYPGMRLIPRRRKTRAKRVRAGRAIGLSMLIKLGVCAAACLLIAVVKLTADAEADRANAVDAVATGAEDEQYEELLGRLKFVELPSILTVFSSESKMPMPCGGIVLETEYALTILAVEGDPAVSPCAGTVRMTGEDDKLGAYAVITMNGDEELTVYGITDISVETGQKLVRGDTLGKAQEKVTLCVTVRGRPAVPAEYFDTGRTAA